MSDNVINTIDAAIAKAKANLNTKEGKSTRKEKLTPEQRAAKRATRDENRVAEKAERKAARAAKKAAREAKKAARGNILPGTARLATAEARLPALSQVTVSLLSTVNDAGLNETETVALIAHLQHSLRARQTVKAATGTDIVEGQTVKVVAGEVRFIGKVGTVTKVSRIRCHVAIEGRDKPLYLFTSDVVAVDEVAATGTDG
jgi:hypothetical protein